MATLLLIVIYISFIGLGLPDSVFGSVWPAIYADLNLPASFGSFVTIIISIGTAISSFFAARLINKFGTKRVTFFSTLLITVSLLGFSMANSMVFLCICSIPAGLGAGAIDAGLNNYIALNYKAKYMHFLHCFYGVGVVISPYLISIALSFNNDWRLGYRIIFFVQLFITILSLVTLPLWNKVKSENNAQEYKGKTLSTIELMKLDGIWSFWIIYFTTTAIEFTCGTWSCAYLVETAGVSESLAAKLFLFFYVGMTVGRFLSGLLSDKLNYKNIMTIGCAIEFIGILLLFIPLPIEFRAVSLLLIGLGNGPLYPNMSYETPKRFGKEVCMSVIGSNMLVATLGILIMPPIFSILADLISFEIFPLYLLVLFVIMVIATITFTKKRKTKSEI